MGHVNAQSLPSSIDDIRYYLHDTVFHAMAISETWLREEIPGSLVAVPGYVLIRNDRGRGGGGGVGLYLKSGLRYRVL